MSLEYYNYIWCYQDGEVLYKNSKYSPPEEMILHDKLQGDAFTKCIWTYEDVDPGPKSNYIFFMLDKYPRYAQNPVSLPKRFVYIDKTQYEYFRTYLPNKELKL